MRITLVYGLNKYYGIYGFEANVRIYQNWLHIKADH